MTGSTARVLVVDDSAVVRGLLVKAIEGDPAIELAGTAMHGEAALSVLARTPVDIVLLDVEMPVMDGLAALQEIQRRYPTIRVIMVSGHTQDGADTTVKALAMGAAGCVAKPAGKNPAESVEMIGRELRPLMHALIPSLVRQHAAPATVRSSPQPQKSAAPVNRLVGQSALPPKVIVIGSSTGGPQALRAVLTKIPASLPIPILIVQHMPPMFTPMLARHLESDTGRTTFEAQDGMLLENDKTYVAPGDYHLVISGAGERRILRLNQEPPECFCRPSVNPLFRSAANLFNNRVAAIMLTGMGEDGLLGTREVVANGGWVLAQDEASSVVWGMPGAIARAGLTDEILPLDQIAPTLLRRCQVES